MQENEELKLPSPEQREKLALVIPTLCEEENIGGLLAHVRSVLDPLNLPYEILVVDDDSTDGTGAVVSAIAREDRACACWCARGSEASPAQSFMAGRIRMPRFWA